MTILKSKAFWGFSTLMGGVCSAVAYDRYEAHLIRQFLLKEASRYGAEPLYPNQSSRCLSLFLVSRNGEDRRACTSTLKHFALEILTVAGVDYKWIVAVDGVEAKGKWDAAARDTNQPELMREAEIDAGELIENILRPVICSETTNTGGLWKNLRDEYGSVPVGRGEDGFLCIDRFTYDNLLSELRQRIIQRELELEQAVVSSSGVHDGKKSSWLKWLSPSQIAVPEPPSSSNFDYYLYYLPCDLSQSPLTRLFRFLFGQRHITKTIGEAALSCVRNEPTDKIKI